MSYAGQLLKTNMMEGRPTRIKSYLSYVGMTIPPCGDFEPSQQSTRSVPPWLNHSRAAKNSTLSLHDEIILFVEYITPSPQEVAIRSDVVERFKTLVESLNPVVTAVPFGSYITCLNLPTSDIDMMLTSRVPKIQYLRGSTLRELYFKLLHSDFSSEIQEILKATVPLIRVTDKKTGIEIDLTGPNTHCAKSTQAVAKWLEHDGDITRVLILVVKVFLSVRRCGTTYTGGINSYVLVWMVVAWVNLEWPKLRGTATTSPKQGHDATSRSDFGEALKGFLKFYGTQFDYERQAIKIEPTPRYTSKTDCTRRYLLSIFDPAEPTLDMGAKAYGIKHIKESFKEAYNTLTEGGSRIGAGGLLGEMIGGDFTKYVQRGIFSSEKLLCGFDQNFAQ